MKKHINKILSIIILSAVVLSSFAMYSCREPEKQEKKYEAIVIQARHHGEKIGIEEEHKMVGDYPTPPEEIEVEFNGDTYVCQYVDSRYYYSAGDEVVHNYEGDYNKYSKRKDERIVAEVFASTGKIFQIFVTGASFLGTDDPEFENIEGGYEALRRRADEIAIQYGATDIEDYIVYEPNDRESELIPAQEYVFRYRKTINGYGSSFVDGLDIYLYSNGDIKKITVPNSDGIEGGPNVSLEEDVVAMGKALAEKLDSLFKDSGYYYTISNKHLKIMEDGSLGVYYVCTVRWGDTYDNEGSIVVLVREVN